jgi:hypothetical protein
MMIPGVLLRIDPILLAPPQTVQPGIFTLMVLSAAHKQGGAKKTETHNTIRTHNKNPRDLFILRS